MKQHVLQAAALVTVEAAAAAAVAEAALEVRDMVMPEALGAGGGYSLSCMGVVFRK